MLKVKEMKKQNSVIGGLVPKEERERVTKEYRRKHPFPSCATCVHKQITVLKYRKYNGEIIIKESTGKCELNLDFDSSGALRRAVKCVGYETGKSQYRIQYESGKEYDLKKSEKLIGQLYPILEAKDGSLIDGFHREETNKNWKRLRLEHIDTDEKKIAARIIANFHRRQVADIEKHMWFNELAGLYQEQGLKVSVGSQHKNEIVEKITEVTGVSKQTAVKYLNSQYLQPEKEYLTTKTQQPRVLASQRIEKKLGKEVVDRFREEVKEELKEDLGFLNESLAHQQTKDEETRKQFEEMGIPPVSEQLNRYYSQLAKLKIPPRKETTKAEHLDYVKGFIKRKNLTEDLVRDREFQREVLKEINKTDSTKAICPTLPPIVADPDDESAPSSVESTTKIICPKCGHKFNIAEAKIL